MKIAGGMEGERQVEQLVEQLEREIVARDVRHFVADGGGQHVLARFAEHGVGQQDGAMEGHRPGDISGAQQLDSGGGEGSFAARQERGEAAGRGIAADLPGPVEGRAGIATTRKASHMP